MERFEIKEDTPSTVEDTCIVYVKEEDVKNEYTVYLGNIWIVVVKSFDYLEKGKVWVQINSQK